MSEVHPTALMEQSAYYDSEYAGGAYMADFTDLFEACRESNIRQELAELRVAPAAVLDYGCGQGRYLGLVSELLPQAQLIGADVSATALAYAKERVPAGRFVLMADEHVDVPDACVDLLLSVEVLEHVADVRLAVSEISRALRPGGVAIISTPCANRWSLEWLSNRLRRNGLQSSHDGYGRFSTDPPIHLRRLQSRDLDILLREVGLRVDHFSFRAHLFTTLVANWRVGRLVPMRIRIWTAMLDWRLWRNRPNGATMIAVARKT